jgi:hypothetical protein
MKGEIVYLFAFDVAQEIRTAKINAILAQQPFPFQIRPERTLPRDVPLYRPLAVEPLPLRARLRGQEVRPLVRVYDVGAVTVAFRVAVEAAQVLDLLSFHEPQLENGDDLGRVARELCAQVCQGLQGLMVAPSEPAEPEAYTLFCLTDLGGAAEVGPWLEAERRNVAGLLAETDPARLSAAQVEETLRCRYSFETSDLTVIDWDAALVVDLSGYTDDVAYVLELANLQCEEFRVMDGKLDHILDRAYGDLDRWHLPLWGWSARVLKELRRIRMDVTKLADEVSHITKFLGDWYLARVYQGAHDRFHLGHWRTSVEQRLAQLDQLYSVFHAEINEQKMLWLEILIVVLFAVDIVGLFFFKK